MKSIKTEIIINASISKVWKILMNFKDYPNWNPFIKKISGTGKTGEILDVIIQAEGQKPFKVKPTVLKNEHEKEFRWLGHLFFKGLFDGEHYFKLDTIDIQTTKLTHGENFQGVLVSMILKMIGKSTENGFKSMNQALKEKAEKEA